MNFLEHLKTRNGKINMLSPHGLITGVILIVILFTVVSVALPEAQTAGNLINETAGLPLKSFFASDGVVFLAIMGAIVIGIVAMVLSKKSGR